MNAPAAYRLLCVCTGNICRSPTAEALLRHHAQLRGAGHALHVDSAGTHAYHTGEAPDPRTVDAAMQHGLPMEGIRARAVRTEDFTAHDLILAMDRSHAAHLRRIAPPETQHRIALFLEYCGLPPPHDVPDPYYSGTQQFLNVFRLINQAAPLVLDRIGLTSG